MFTSLKAAKRAVCTCVSAGLMLVTLPSILSGIQNTAFAQDSSNAKPAVETPKPDNVKQPESESAEAKETPETTDPYAGLPDDVIALAKERMWLPGEALAWSCVREGKEADLWHGRCVTPRRSRIRKQLITENHCGRPQTLVGRPLTASNEEHKPYPLVYRSQFIIDILSTPELNAKIHPIGVRIVGGTVCDKFSLENVDTVRNLVLDRTQFRKDVSLQNFTTTKNVSFDNTNVLGTIAIRRSTIGGTLFMTHALVGNFEVDDTYIRHSFNARGSMFLLFTLFKRANIDGEVILSDTRLTHLIMRSNRIGARIIVDSSQVRCSLQLAGNTITGDLHLELIDFGKDRSGTGIFEWDIGGKWGSGRKMPSEIAEYVERRMRNHGEDYKKWFANGTSTSERWNYGDCRGDKYSKKPVQGLLRLNDQRVSGTLCLRNVYGDLRGHKTFDKKQRAPIDISINGIRAEGPVVFVWTLGTRKGLDVRDGARAHWHFVGIQAKTIYTNLNNWPRRYDVHNVRYDMMVEGGPRCDLDTRASQLNRFDEASIIDWLGNNQIQSAQSYGQVIGMLNAIGQDPSEVKIAQAQLRLQRRYQNAIGWTEIYAKVQQRFATKALANVQAIEASAADLFDWLWSWTKIFLVYLYGQMIDYGHRPLKIITWIIGTTAIFLFVLRMREGHRSYRVRTVGAEVEYVKPNLFYALDMFIPFIKLRDAHYEFELEDPLARVSLYIYQMIGYLFSAFLVAGISGLTS